MKRKRWIRRLSCAVLCLLMFAGSAVTGYADENENALSAELAHVWATYADEAPKDVTTEVMELDGGVMTDLGFEVQLKNAGSAARFRLVQYRASDKRFVELLSSASPSFSVDVSDFYEGIPVYLLVEDANGKELLVRMLMIRVNHGRAGDLIPADISSEYTSEINVPMDELLPGMKFVMHPYLIPMTARVYTDGRFVIGMGINSSNTSFWKDCAKGTLNTGSSAKELQKAFWGKSENKSAVSGGNMGLIFDFCGWVQGNMYSTEPLKGELTAFVGTGFNITGQYLILTWEVTVTGGADGVFDFHLSYNEDSQKYENFEVDKFGIGVKAGLELYGGLGLSSVASVGVYGAGSVAGYTLIYPEAAQDSLVLAGECGFKVKLFSRTLFSFSIVSGSYDFIRKTGGGRANLQQEKIGEYLLANDYASASASVHEPDTAGIWHTDGNDPDRTAAAALKGYEEEEDFAHLVAENVYPDNRLQIVETGTRNVPQMNVVFLGSDPSRKNGNRSRLMNLFYIDGTGYLSDPGWINEDDGTADYDPYAYHSYSLTSERTYIVWRNGLEAFDETSTLEDISRGSDIYFAEHQFGSAWKDTSRVTNYAFGNAGVFAAGAKVSEENDEPVVTYYLNSVKDPAGLDDTYTHDVYTAKRGSDGKWKNRKAFSVQGCIQELESARFGGSQKIAVSYSQKDESGSRVYKVELWEGGRKVFERNNASNGQFLRIGYNDTMLTWYEDGRLYGIREGAPETVTALTPGDFRIPGSDYRVYCRYGSNAICLVGTGSAESSENAYAIASLNGGRTWNRVELTDIDNNALVNEISIAFAEGDEPVLFYSVQHYISNFDESAADAENFLTGARQNDSFAGLQEIMPGRDDPRFSDTQADLYVKAKRANQKVRISDVTFTDEDAARKGQPTPVSLVIENAGFYDIDSIFLYADGKKICELPVSLKFGEAKTVSAEYTVPDDCPDEPLTVVFGASSRESGVIESECAGTLQTGHISVRYAHEFIYAETLSYTVTNDGFAAKKVYIHIFDEDTGEYIYNYPAFVPAGGKRTGTYSIVKGLWRQQGHENIMAYVSEDAAKPEEFDSTRCVSFRSLEEIYLQDTSGMPLKSSDESSDADDSGESGAEDGSAEDGSGAESDGESGGGAAPSGAPYITPDPSYTGTPAPQDDPASSGEREESGSAVPSPEEDSGSAPGGDGGGEDSASGGDGSGAEDGSGNGSGTGDGSGGNGSGTGDGSGAESGGSEIRSEAENGTGGNQGALQAGNNTDNGGADAVKTRSPLPFVLLGCALFVTALVLLLPVLTRRRKDRE